MLRTARLAMLLPLVAAIAPAAIAPAALAQDHARNDQERLGERLVNQSCVVCHLQLQITNVPYAPALSSETLSGKAEVMRDVISNGSPHMPGFKIQFEPAQIDAIVAYIKTIPAPSAAPKARKAGGAGEPD
jgi:mono/diheme cytochrome c family protein